MVQFLLETNPASISIKDKYGGLPLHRCALQNRTADALSVTQLLVDAMPDALEQPDGWSRTPLLCAVESGRGPGVIPFLEILNGGPEGDSVIFVENKKGQTPLDKVQSMKQGTVDPVVYDWLESHFTV